MSYDQTQIQKRPDQILSGYLKQYDAQLKAALPAHISPERMSRLTLTAFNASPKVSKCDIASVLSCVISAAQMGLEIGVGGQAYLVPYYNSRERKNICTLIPGWLGYIDLINRAAKCTVKSYAVFDGDDFDYNLGINPNINHKPCGEFNPDKITYCYAVGKIKGMEGEPYVEVWSREKAIAHRDNQNKVGGSHYSFKHWEMYFRKIVIMQVIKFMPKSTELQIAQKVDVMASEGVSGSYLNGEFTVLGDENSTHNNDGEEMPEKPAIQISYDSISAAIESMTGLSQFSAIANMINAMPEDERETLHAKLSDKEKTLSAR